jgi:pimeloyl-ACP methyl ester carboxylesterase
MQLAELETYRHTASTRSGEISYLEVVHGVATNAYLWRNVMGALAGQRRCIAVDLPGHGRSPVTAEQDLSLAALAAGLEDFCDALGLSGVDLVANDTGGAIAQIFAARHPERLATLTLTNCETSDNVPPESFKPTVALARSGRLAPMTAALFGDLDAAARVAFGTGYEHLDQVDPDVIRSYLEPCFGTLERARQFERLLASLDAGDLVAVTPLLEELTVPTLVVWGTGDAFFEVSWAYWLRDTIPGITRVVTVEDARLFFPDERPMDLVPHLKRHWAEAAAVAAVRTR